MASRRELDEANAIRASLGMAPLGADAPSKPSNGHAQPTDDTENEFESRQAAADNNWRKHEEDKQAKRKRDEKRKKLARDIEIAQRDRKLEGKGLAESDGEEEDTVTWLKGGSKRQKKLDRQRKKEAAAAEKAKKAAEEDYGEKDLQGARVGHDVDDFDNDETEKILTLKDRAVDAPSDEEDELENEELRGAERLRAKLDAKKKNHQRYNAAEAFDGKQSILSQYDETIDGKKQSSFTIGSTAAPKKQRISLDDLEEQMNIGRSKITLDLDTQDRTKSSDYQAPAEVKFKKPKKKAQSTKRKRAAEEDPARALGVDSTNDEYRAAVKRKVDHSNDQVEEDSLAPQFSASRIDALKNRKRMRPEDIAAEIVASREMEMDVDEDDDEGEGLILGDAARFVKGLDDEERLEVVEKRRQREEERLAKIKAAQEEKKPEKLYGEEADSEDEGMPDFKEEESSEDERSNQDDSQPKDRAGLAQDISLTQGIGPLMNMLRRQGQFDDSGADEASQRRQRQAGFDAELRARLANIDAEVLAAREKDRKSGQQNRLTQKEREDRNAKLNAEREFRHSREIQKFYDAKYRPDADIKYVDEFGRRMDPREAFKELSHQFHGKNSGNAKKDLRLKKLATERTRRAKELPFSHSKRHGDPGQGSSA